MSWFFLSLLSAWFSAFAAIAQKKVLFNQSPLRFSYQLALVNLIFALPFFFFVDYHSVTPANMSLLFVKSIIGVGAFLCVMTALKNLQISNALPLLALTPGFVAVAAFFILGESLHQKEIFGLVFFIIGTFILETKEIKKSFAPLKIFPISPYHRYILFALLLFTASSILDKLLIVKMHLSPLSITAFQHLYFAFLFTVIFFSLRENRGGIVRQFKKEELGWLVLISLLTIGYRYTQIVSISMASVALTLAVKRTSVLWATIVGGKVFSDSKLLQRTIAVLFILIGALLILRD